MNKFQFIFFIEDTFDFKIFFLIIGNCINQNIIINYKNYILMHQLINKENGEKCTSTCTHNLYHLYNL